VLASLAFSRPRRLSRLLKHLVEHTLRGKQDCLKETLLGIEVFDRGQDFDPKADPIVRIDARRLRARLTQYYADEGATDSVLIVLEPGSYVPSFRRREEQETKPEFLPLPSRNRHSVAVLPFSNLSDLTGYELFCEGLSEDILNRLTQHEGLRVIARASAFQFRDPTCDPRHIAKQLRVDTLVTGSLRGDNEDMRITAQLVNAEDSTILWSQEYRQTAAGILEFQERISRDVVARFQNRPGSDAPLVQTRPIHGNADSAYRLFLRGRRLLHQGSREGYLQAIDSLEAAVKADPAYAAAWSNLSIACASALMFRLRNAKSLVDRARFAAQKALELDALSPDAHTALGYVSGLADFNWTEAKRWFDSALQANPLYGFARIGRAMLWCAPTRQLDEAEDELERVLSNDPLNAEAQINLGRVFYFERRFDLAAEMLQAVLDSSPQHGNAWIMLAFVREQMGMKQEAVDAYRHWERLLSSSFTTTWTNAVEQILLGNPKPAERIARKMAWMARLTPFPLAGFVADLYIRLGDYDQAVNWLEKAYQERAIRLICAAVEPVFDPVRNHPRFNSLLTKIVGDTVANSAEQAKEALTGNHSSVGSLSDCR